MDCCPEKVLWTIAKSLLLLLKFIYSEKATKFCEIFPLPLPECTVVERKGKVSQSFVTFSEYMNCNDKKLCNHKFLT